MINPTRIKPNMGAESYKTFQVRQPKATHFRKATCEEVECPAMMNGWVTTIDESTDLGQKQGYFIRKNSGRMFKEERLPSGLTQFTFAAGQPCFQSEAHQVPLDRPGLYIVKDGDWRGNPRGTTPRRHKNAEEWVEEFAEHQDKLKDARDKG